MASFLGLIFVIIALQKKHSNDLIKLLIWLQIITFVMHIFVANTIDYASAKTFFNIFFVNACLLFIIYPWGYGRIKDILVNDSSFFIFYKKNLYHILKLNLFVFILIAVIVWVFIPDIVALKRDKAFNDLYVQIPYFSFFYRYASITKYLGLLALPFFAYYLKKDELKEARKALLLSFSVFIIGVATYNRAVMITYITLCVSVYLFIKSNIPLYREKTIGKYLKRVLFIVVFFLAFITIGRFSSSSMDYYRDQIPPKSLIKNPSVYSLFNYASQGYVNGINFLELYDGENKIWGRGVTYDFMQMLAFFNLVEWDHGDYFVITDRAYNIKGLSENNKSDNFHGYTADMVVNFGYILTFLLSLLYFMYVRNTLRKQKTSFMRMSILVLLMVIPLNSIFYMSYNMLLFPLLFIIIIKSFYTLFRYGAK